MELKKEEKFNGSATYSNSLKEQYSMNNASSEQKHLSLINKTEMNVRKKNRKIGLRDMYREWNEILDEAVKLGSSFYQASSGDLDTDNSLNLGSRKALYKKKKKLMSKRGNMNNNRLIGRNNEINNHFSNISKNYSTHRLQSFSVRRLREEEHLKAISYRQKNREDKKFDINLKKQFQSKKKFNLTKQLLEKKRQKDKLIGQKAINLPISQSITQCSFCNPKDEMDFDDLMKELIIIMKKFSVREEIIVYQIGNGNRRKIERTFTFTKKPELNVHLTMNTNLPRKTKHSVKRKNDQ